MKVQRHEAKKVYKNEIQDLYKEGMLAVDKEAKWSDDWVNYSNNFISYPWYLLSSIE